MIKSYLQPTSIDEAVKLKDELKNQAIYYAGGTEINSTELSKIYTHMISTEQLDLNEIIQNPGEILIGSAVTLQMLLDSEAVPEPIKTASGCVKNRNIRNMATIGGNIAVNRSCSILLPLLMVMKVKLTTFDSDGEQKLSIEEYQQQPQNKLITNISIPVASKRFIDINHFSRTANDISILNIAVSLKRDGENISELLVAVGGVSQHVIRLYELEKQLINRPLPDRKDLEGLIKGMIDPISDLRGSAEFKSYLTGVLVTDSIYKAYNQEVL